VPTDADVSAFIDSIDDQHKRVDSRELMALMREATGDVPRMWGENIIGFGTHRYRYASGREGETAAVAFSPRKAALTIYGIASDADAPARFDDLGPCRRGKGCLYIKRLSDVDLAVLRGMTKDAYAARSQSGQD
jgi:Domain of unknown function (DU1801)